MVRERLISGQISSSRLGRKTLFIGLDGRDVEIEHFALQHYRTEGWEGLWTENGYWWHHMLFLYWDVIFAPPSGVHEPRWGRFDSPILELLISTDFYTRRQKIIEKRHKSLCGGTSLGIQGRSPEDELKIGWHKHNSFYRGNWASASLHLQAHGSQKFSIEELAIAPRVLSNQQLTAIMDRLLHFSDHHTGLPDLFLVKDGHPMFVEVKQRGEQMRQAQSEWHEFLVLKAGVPIEVCRVRGVTGNELPDFFPPSTQRRRIAMTSYEKVLARCHAEQWDDWRGTWKSTLAFCEYLKAAYENPSAVCDDDKLLWKAIEDFAAKQKGENIAMLIGLVASEVFRARGYHRTESTATVVTEFLPENNEFINNAKDDLEYWRRRTLCETPCVKCDALMGMHHFTDKGTWMRACVADPLPMGMHHFTLAVSNGFASYTGMGTFVCPEKKEERA